MYRVRFLAFSSILVFVFAMHRYRLPKATSRECKWLFVAYSKGSYGQEHRIIFILGCFMVFTRVHTYYVRTAYMSLHVLTQRAQC